MEQIVTVMRVRDIHFIVPPAQLLEVHMHDNQAVTRTAIVPAFLLAVLQEVKLIGLPGVTDEIALSTGTHGFHVCDARCLRQFLRLIPSQIHLLHGHEVRRAPASVGIVTAIQQIPLINSREAGRGAQGIDVRKTHCMKHLMGDGSKPIQGTVSPQLCGNGAKGVIDVTRQQELFILRIRPDITPFLVPGITGCHEEQLVHLPVPIPVIDGEIGLLGVIQLFRSISNHIHTIVGAGMTTGSLRDLKRAIDIKLNVQTSVRLIAEIVGQTAYPYPFVITLFIKHTIVIR